MFETDKRFYVYGLFYEADDGHNECFYIVKGTGNRYKEHFKDCRKGDNPHKDRKIKKLKREGYDVFGGILTPYLTEEQAYQLEEALLQRDKVFESVTNISRKATGFPSGKDHPMRDPEVKQKVSEAMTGREYSDETREKMSKAAKKRFSNPENHPDYGVPKSEDHKRKIAETLKGRSLSDERCKNISERTTGSTNPNSSLGPEKVREIRWLVKNSDMNQTEIGEMYNVAQTTVSHISVGRIWDHIDGLLRPEDY